MHQIGVSFFDPNVAVEWGDADDRLSNFLGVTDKTGLPYDSKRDYCICKRSMGVQERKKKEASDKQSRKVKAFRLTLQRVDRMTRPYLILCSIHTTLQGVQNNAGCWPSTLFIQKEKIKACFLVGNDVCSFTCTVAHGNAE